MPTLKRCSATSTTFDGDVELRCCRTTRDPHGDDDHVYAPADQEPWPVFGQPLPDPETGDDA